MKLLDYLTNWVSSSLSNCFTAFAFNSLIENPQPFNTGLPQGSPLSPILIVIYSSVMAPLAPRPAQSACATFKEDIALFRAALDIPTVVVQLKSDIDTRLHRAQFRNIHLTPPKVDLLLLIPPTSSWTTPDNAPLVMLGPHPVHPSPAIKILGVWVDYRLTFFRHVDTASFKLWKSAARLKCIAQDKDLSPAALYHVCRSTTLPSMLWGSPSWWTGTRSVLDYLTTVYHSLPPEVWQPKSFICKHAPLCDSGNPPLDLLLDRASQGYRIRILFSDPYTC